MPLVINSLGGGDTHTYRCPHSKKPGMRVPACGHCMPGLITKETYRMGLKPSDILHCNDFTPPSFVYILMSMNGRFYRLVKLSLVILKHTAFISN